MKTKYISTFGREPVDDTEFELWSSTLNEYITYYEAVTGGVPEPEVMDFVYAMNNELIRYRYRGINDRSNGNPPLPAAHFDEFGEHIFPTDIDGSQLISSVMKMYYMAGYNYQDSQHS